MALKISWIKKIYTRTPKWRTILQEACPDINSIEIYGPQKLLNSRCNQFWKNVFEAYIKFVKNVKLYEEAEVLAEPLFYNENFKIGNKTFFYKKWVNKNILFVKDLVDENGAFLDYSRFCEKYDIKVNYLDFMGCIRTIKSYLTIGCIKITGKVCLEKPKALTVISQLKKGSKECYRIMLDKILIFDISAFGKWEQKIQTVIDWEKTAKYIGKIKEVKLKWFQIRLCHNILVTNSIFKKWG